MPSKTSKLKATETPKNFPGIRPQVPVGFYLCRTFCLDPDYPIDFIGLRHRRHDTVLLHVYGGDVAEIYSQSALSYLLRRTLII